MLDLHAVSVLCFSTIGCVAAMTRSLIWAVFRSLVLWQFVVALAGTGDEIGFMLIRVSGIPKLKAVCELPVHGEWLHHRRDVFKESINQSVSSLVIWPTPVLWLMTDCPVSMLRCL